MTVCFGSHISSEHTNTIRDMLRVKLYYNIGNRAVDNDDDVSVERNYTCRVCRRQSVVSRGGFDRVGCRRSGVARVSVHVIITKLMLLLVGMRGGRVRLHVVAAIHDFSSLFII